MQAHDHVAWWHTDPQRTFSLQKQLVAKALSRPINQLSWSLHLFSFIPPARWVSICINCSEDHQEQQFTLLRRSLQPMWGCYSGDLPWWLLPALPKANLSSYRQLNCASSPFWEISFNLCEMLQTDSALIILSTQFLTSTFWQLDKDDLLRSCASVKVFNSARSRHCLCGHCISITLAGFDCCLGAVESVFTSQSAS